MLISMPIVDRHVLWRHGACDVSRTGNTVHPIPPGRAIAGALSLVGFAGLLYRRLTSHRVMRTTTRMGYLTYLRLTVLIVLGCWMTFAHNLITNDPYNYRPSIGVWWRSIFYLHPNVSAASGAPIVYQVHAIIAWLFWAAFPFSRLVHGWSIPLQYVGRPYILYRRRYSTAAR